ncbi:phospholipase A2 hemilipin-like [Ornithodoros turicata]|uniref:phospholipase A2 hemilipin-like n=1 Tax=Ornithodoros turicata TaxID=34597 RepID=UPI003139BEBD
MICGRTAVCPRRSMTIRMCLNFLWFVWFFIIVDGADTSNNSSNGTFWNLFDKYSKKSPEDIARYLIKTATPGVRHRIVTDVSTSEKGHRLVEIFQDKNDTALDCNILGDRRLIQAALMLIPSAVVTNVEEQHMDYFVDLCYNRTESKTMFQSILTYINGVFKSLFIFPGTKWCGAGDVAKNYDDLGRLNATDACCREHDNSQNIPAFTEKHGIKNWHLYTMTHCVKDRRFYNCLLGDRSAPSVVVGKTFFNILKVECYIETYPKKCVRKNWFYIPLLTTKCNEYELDKSEKREWQKFSAPNFMRDFLKKMREKLEM